MSLCLLLTVQAGLGQQSTSSIQLGGPWAGVGSRLLLHQLPSITHPPAWVILSLSFAKFLMQKVSAPESSHRSPWAGNNAQCTPDPCMNPWAPCSSKGKRHFTPLCFMKTSTCQSPTAKDPSRLFFLTYSHCTSLQYEIKEKRGGGSRRAVAGKKCLTNSNSSPTPL